MSKTDQDDLPHWIYDPLAIPRAYYHSMTGIGPRFTRAAAHAALFGSRRDAEECGFSFGPLILWEAEVACLCSRAGGKGLCTGCQAEYDAIADLVQLAPEEKATHLRSINE